MEREFDDRMYRQSLNVSRPVEAEMPDVKQSQLQLIVERARRCGEQAAQIEERLCSLYERLNGPLPSMLGACADTKRPEDGMIGDAHRALDQINERLSSCSDMLSQIRDLV